MLFWRHLLSIFTFSQKLLYRQLYIFLFPPDQQLRLYYHELCILKIPIQRSYLPLLFPLLFSSQVKLELAALAALAGQKKGERGGFPGRGSNPLDEEGTAASLCLAASPDINPKNKHEINDFSRFFRYYRNLQVLNERIHRKKPFPIKYTLL